jgi:hypothetical protein
VVPEEDDNIVQMTDQVMEQLIENNQNQEAMEEDQGSAVLGVAASASVAATLLQPR